MPFVRAALLTLLLGLIAASPVAAQDRRLEQAKEEAGPLSTPIGQIDTPVGRLALGSAELLSARFDQPIRFTLTLDRPVESGVIEVALPRRWRERGPGGLRPSTAPAQRGRARGVRVGRSGSTVQLVLDGAAAGTALTAELRDRGIPPGTYRLPVSYSAGSAAPRRIGTLELRLYARVREEAEVSEWSEVRAVNVSNAPGDQSESFITTVPGNPNRLIAGANGGTSGYSAWISENGGTTWTELVVPTTADQAGTSSALTLDICCDPMSAADSAGNMWYGGLSLEPNSRIHVSRVPAGSSQFAGTVALQARTSGTQDKPMMTIDNAASSPTYGRLYVAWSEPSNGGVNIVVSACDTRAGGSLDAARCDNADNWSAPVSVTKSVGGYIYADVATGPGGKAYVVWWDYANNTISGATCSSACTTAAGWSVAGVIATLDATGGRPIPFECPIVAQPGGRASTGPNIEVDISGTASNGRVWVAWSDLRPGSGTTRCADDVEPVVTHLTFDSFAASAVNALPGAAQPSASVATRLLSDGEGGGQASSDDWFPWITVDQTTGRAYAAWYSTRDDVTRNTTHFYVRSVAPNGDLGGLTRASLTPSNYSTNRCCNFGNDYGDYSGLDATSGVVFPVWSDRSGADGEVLMDKLKVSAPGPTPKLSAGSLSFTDAAPDGDGDGVAEPGETLSVTIPVSNSGTAAATSTSGTLSSTLPDVTLPDGTASYGTIDPGSTAQPDAPYRLTLADTLSCNTSIPLTVNVASSNGATARTYSIDTGRLHVSTAVPKAIPDPGSMTSTVTVPASGTIDDVDVRLNIAHTWVGDLRIELEHPDRTKVWLVDRFGDGNYHADHVTNLILDDEAAAPAAGAAAPFTGRYRPQGQLSSFDGKPAAGTWTLTISDVSAPDPGTLLDWALLRGGCTTPAPANKPPVAAISGPSTAEPGETVVFDASGSSDPDGSITSYEWDLDGEGSFETTTASSSVSTTFSDAGSYAVKVRAVDDDGALSAPAQTLITVSAVVATPIPTPTPTPTPIATAAPTATPNPAVATPFVALVRPRSAIRPARSGVFSVPIAGCKQCRGTLVLRSSKKIRGRTLRIARVSFRVGATGAATARFKLSAANRRLLKRLKRIPVRATLTIADSTGRTASGGGRLTLRR